MNAEALVSVIQKVAEGTPSDELVVALYLMDGPRHNRGTAYVHAWLSPREFSTGRGKWSMTQNWVRPEGLPDRYKLIRLRLDAHAPAFPRAERDTYGWEFHFERLEDHVALLFAHELHHYRRYHLGLHPGKGEQSANRWALEHVRRLGFHVEARRYAMARRHRPGRIWKISETDPFSSFRNLTTGEWVMITHDPRKRYQSEKAEVLRPIRTHSRRMVIQTRDGKQWRWPMVWLSVMDRQKSG